ncbi:uncharacterized protein BJ171DRAFT_584203 [Polychytrium aggregatum]|uniref:uncharacterized protein n=1 Tax=Polychytrium aggregatum TaxID=110093 RepID=UPI0022FEC224|nr:uncharacterized protein BJ171DRAFT_584203 [Polychytrium aggregatum]KAI9202294.1 hypothetical protein BJ171DRAFT_584203 [Polychytrium aggregatum]
MSKKAGAPALSAKVAPKPHKNPAPRPPKAGPPEISRHRAHESHEPPASSRTPKIDSPADDSAKAFVPLETGLRRIQLQGLVDAIKPILTHPVRPYTPLILDRAGHTDAFFTYASEYGGLFVDAKKFLSQVSIQKTMDLAQALEEMRRTLVSAMKYGKTLVIRMANTAVDFQSKFTGPTTFPTADLLVEGGRRFHEERYWRSVVRDEDMDTGCFLCRPEFCVVVTTTFAKEDYREYLEKALPLGEMIPVCIDE